MKMRKRLSAMFVFGVLFMFAVMPFDNIGEASQPHVLGFWDAVMLFVQAYQCDASSLSWITP
jgi:hypothetical protein